MFEPLTDTQWALLEPLFTKPEKRGRGKPHASWRTVLNSILFVLLTGTKWGMLPKTAEFASKSAAHRWYSIWNANGFLEQILSAMQGLATITQAISFPPKRQRRSHTAVEPNLMIEQYATA